MQFALCAQGNPLKKLDGAVNFVTKFEFDLVFGNFYVLIAVALLRMYIDEGCNEKLLSCSEKSYTKEVNLDGARVVQQILDSEGKVSAGVLPLLLLSSFPSLKYCLFIGHSTLVRQRPMKSLSSVCSSVRPSLNFIKIGALVFFIFNMIVDRDIQ